MKFTERREFLYDNELFKRSDVVTALKIHHEYTIRSSAKPAPKFYEVDRNIAGVDQLWMQPVDGKKKFSRLLEIPCIVTFAKLDWRLIRTGRTAKQKVNFWISNLTLQQQDYFPLQGDLVRWNGNRLEITGVDFEQTAYWHQTNVWLGLVIAAEIVPDGDELPTTLYGEAAPTEMSNGKPATQMVNPSQLSVDLIPDSKV